MPATPLDAFDALPPGGRFLLAPGLTGDGVLVGRGTPSCVVEAEDPRPPPWRELLAPGPLGTVVLLGYELGRPALGAREALRLPRAVALRIDELERLPSGPLPRPSPTSPAEVHGSFDEASHAAAVRAIHAALRAGESYQCNLTARLHGAWDAGATALLAALADELPEAAALLELPGGATVVSASPETLLRFDAASRLAQSFPIKGTRRRGATSEEDEALARELAADPKERAEHVMIVDLVRNDLGRVAASGSVQVCAPFSVLRLPGILHLVTEVRATLAPGHDLPALLASLFPAGSITGAPKERTIGLLEELEPVARGPYCGAIGLVRPDGSAAFSVAIRTAVLTGGRAYYGAGGGVTIGSEAAREWAELRLKAARFLRALAGA